MKKKIVFIVAFLASVPILAQEFEFEKELINYGKIAKGTDGYKVFKFKNIGNVPLIITDIKTSCDCAVSKKPEKPIMPNEEATITVSYDTNETGGFSKVITIFSNAKNKVKKLRIKGYITK